MMKKEVCIKFLDDIKSRADKISIQSQPFKHLGLDMSKDWILNIQSKIRERLHTGAVGFTDWCYEAVTDFYTRVSGKFPAMLVLVAFDALQEGEIASEMDVRQITTVFKRILMYDEIHEESEEVKKIKSEMELYDEYKSVILYPPRKADGRLRITEIPPQIRKFCEKYKGKWKKEKVKDTDAQGNIVKLERHILVDSVFPRAAGLYWEIKEQEKLEKEEEEIRL